MPKVIGKFLAVSILLALAAPGLGCAPEKQPLPPYVPYEFELPEPRLDSATSIEQTLLKRRSIRDYTSEALTLQEVSQLLWAAQGITDPRGFRTAPSAGAIYPLETYLLVGDVDHLTPGAYRYIPANHKLVKVLEGDFRAELAAAAWGQDPIKEGAANIVITGVYERTIRRYGDRGKRYVHMEAGHAAQNIYLQAVALDLGTVVIGAFHDGRVKQVLNLSRQEDPLYIIPIGKR